MITKGLSTVKRIEPHFIEPMYASAVRELPDGDAWTYEAKLDGYRCLVAKRQKGVVLWSRRGTLFTDRFPVIARACEKLSPNTLIDGEVIAIDADGRISFNALQHSRPNAHIQFYAFDVLIYRGRNVLRLPLEARRQLLSEALAKVEYPALLSTQFNAKPADLIRAAKELEFEGVVAKRKGSFYEPGERNGAWLKYKINKAQEFVIGGYTPGVNPFDALVVGCYEGPELKFVAKVRAGFVPRLRRDVFQRFAGLQIHKCPFTNLPEKRRTMWALTAQEMKDCRWLKPQLVAQIEFTEWTPDGHLRHASFAGLRDDKQPRDVRREQPNSPR
jgi:bifunctional non-homologous end joining protein LigD